MKFREIRSGLTLLPLRRALATVCVSPGLHHVVDVNLSLGAYQDTLPHVAYRALRRGNVRASLRALFLYGPDTPSVFEVAPECVALRPAACVQAGRGLLRCHAVVSRFGNNEAFRRSSAVRRYKPLGHAWCGAALSFPRRAARCSASFSCLGCFAFVGAKHVWGEGV